MSHLDQAVQAKKRFEQAITSRAKPDAGISLKHQRGVNGYQAEINRQQALVAAREEKKAKQELWLQKALAHRVVKILSADESVVVTDVNLRCNPVVTTAPIKDYLTQRYPSLSLIKQIVCRQYSISLTDISSASKCGTLITPRHVAFYIAKKMTPKSLPEIGRAFGGRDHTTVLYGRDKIKKRLKIDAELREEVDKLIAKIEQEIRA